MYYLLDANIFITAKNILPMDIYPSFWSKISDLGKAGVFRSIKKVEEELRRGNDEIVDWIDRELPDDFFMTENESTLTAMSSVTQWTISNPVYTQAAMNKFVTIADSWIVAEALSQTCIVVTHEKSAPNKRSNVKIPDVCNGLGIKYCGLNDAFRDLGVAI